ncbi:ABC transporter ATP-binding protein, partial [Thioclava sp. BHET1]
MQKMPAARRGPLVMAALERVGLAAMAGRRPSELSGGQQQRVAIARAIVGEPALVLFDEPLSNLDRELRESMVGEIAGLVEDLGLTALYVTHDHAEAFSLADEVAVMRAGRIEQFAAPEVLVERPATPFVAEFLRLGPVFAVSRQATGWHLDGGQRIAPPEAAPADSAFVLMPARALRLTAPEEALLSAHVRRCLFRGDAHVATLELAGGAQMQLPVSQRLSAGLRVGLELDAADLRWFAGAPQG